MNVLFIGATGLVGSHTVPLLRDKFALTLTGIQEDELAGMPVRKLDICDWNAIETFMQNGAGNNAGFDAVIYCATANYRHTKRRNSEERRHYYEQCIEVNARGAYHVFEAAWRAGVPRVVHIGSMTAMLGFPQYEYIDVDTRDRPNDLYAATKIFGENVGRSYAFRRPRSGKRMRVICLRLAQPTEITAPKTQRWIIRSRNTEMAADMRDIAHAMECALVTDISYGIYPVVSGADKPYIDPALYAELGYAPRWKYIFTGEDSVAAIPYEAPAMSAATPATEPPL